MFSLLYFVFSACYLGLPVLSQLPPSEDPWYTAPSGFEAASPGQVLRLRPAPGNLTSIYANSSSSWNVLFRTTDSNYRPSWAVSTLLTPNSPHPESLVSYQIPYNTPAIDGSPSYLLYNSTFYTGLVQNDIEALLAKGWFVNIPDFEGHLASFGCAVSEGHATIDSIRAVLSLQNSSSSSSFPSAPPRDSKVAMWGYSGGSIASEFATELQVQYAPELSFAGAALGGLPVNVSTTLPLANKSPFSGLVPAALVGFSTQHAEVNKTLHASLRTTGPHNASTFYSVRDYDILTIFEVFQGQDMNAYFLADDGLETLLRSPQFVEAADRDTIMGYHGFPQFPLYVYKAVHDELAPIEQTDALVQRYCGIGANIQYERNSIGGHLAEETNGDAGALKFLQQILGGSYNHAGCTVRNVAINVTDSAL